MFGDEYVAQARGTLGLVAYHIRARKLLNLFMEMNCVAETFIRLSGLNAIA